MSKVSGEENISKTSDEKQYANAAVCGQLIKTPQSFPIIITTLSADETMTKASGGGTMRKPRGGRTMRQRSALRKHNIKKTQGGFSGT